VARNQFFYLSIIYSVTPDSPDPHSLSTKHCRIPKVAVPAGEVQSNLLWLFSGEEPAASIFCSYVCQQDGPSLDELLMDDLAQHYDYQHTSETVPDAPFMFVHTSGSSGDSYNSYRIYLPTADAR
jgi:hypothetical protein